eukprot:m.136389 g.136389  ORF g.136389 m.136389 type:complete len:62 (+) comp14731_c0_seq4:40-225(+)
MSNHEMFWFEVCHLEHYLLKMSTSDSVSAMASRVITRYNYVKVLNLEEDHTQKEMKPISAL